MKDKELIVSLKKSGTSHNLEPILKRYASFLLKAVTCQCQDSADQNEILHSVFYTLLKHRNRLHKNIFLPTWILRSALYALKYHRSKKADRTIHKAHNDHIIHTDLTIHSDDIIHKERLDVLYDLNRLSTKWMNVILAHTFFEDELKMAEALGISPRQARSRLVKAKRKLEKIISRKKRGKDAKNAVDLSFLTTPIPSEIDEKKIREIAKKCCEQDHRPMFVKGIFSGWRWFFWRRRLKFIGATITVFLALIFSFFSWGLKTGYLTAWLLPKMSLAVLEDYPELAIPPRLWEGEGMLMNGIKTRAGLFGLTNIWRVDLTFSPEKWEAMKPESIKPTALFNESGELILRNPHAPRSGLAGVLGIHFVWSRAHLQIGDHAFREAAVRFRGNGTYIGSLFGKKQPFKIDLNKTHQGQRLFGIDKINFNNFVEDASYMHDALGYDLFRAAGIFAPRTAYAWMRMEITGQEKRHPLGLYLMLENIDQHFSQDRFGISLPIFKPVTPRLFEDLGDEWSDYSDIYDLKTKATDAQKQRIIDFAKCLTHDHDEQFKRRISQFLDLDQFSKFLSVMVLLSSYDGFFTNGQNFYIYLDTSTDRFGFIPWDLDHAWGDFFLIGAPSQLDRASIFHPWTGKHRLLERLMRLDSFREMYERQLKKLLDTEFKLEVLAPKIDMIATSIEPLIECENPLRHSRFREAISDEKGLPPPLTEAKLRLVNGLKRFVEARRKSVLEQLSGESEGVILKSIGSELSQKD